jgi:opacity protein-like surface antigen
MDAAEMNIRIVFLARVLAVAVLAAPGIASAQTDEIQVYDASHAEPGTFNLTWHNNFTPAGIKAPAFPGAVVADRSWNGVPEWAYGVTDWFEAGLYMPLYSVDKNRGGTLDGFKLRALFTVPHADDRRFVYGANFEFSVNGNHWDEKRFTSEVRPIVGWHLPPFDVIFNPILDTSYDGLKNLDFAPSTRVAYHLPQDWAVAAEEYADYGPLHQLYSRSGQSHQLYAVVDHSSKFLDIEAGVGFGLTDASDKITLKLILSRDLNQRTRSDRPH